jgi:hypothetical protein
MPSRSPQRRVRGFVTAGSLALLLTACGAATLVAPTTLVPQSIRNAEAKLRAAADPIVSKSGSPTSTTDPAPTTTAPTTTTVPPLGAAGAGLIPAHVTAIGDSVMIDAAPALQADIPGIDVEAQVSFQFSAGIGLLQQLRAEGRLGAIIVIGLGTNGPFSDTEFDQMMAACAGASRVVFITVHVGQPWQAQVNASLASGVARYPKVAVLADWYAISAPHPEWFYSDGTHLPIGGTGAQALGALVASKVKA